MQLPNWTLFDRSGWRHTYGQRNRNYPNQTITFVVAEARELTEQTEQTEQMVVTAQGLPEVATTPPAQ